MDNTHYTIKPAIGLLIFSCTTAVSSWLSPLSVLLASVVPLIVLLFWTLLSNKPAGLRWWLLPALLGLLISSLFALRFYWLNPGSERMGTDIELQGYIANLPVVKGAVTRFDLDVRDLGSAPFNGKIRLSWFEAPQLTAGEHWRLTVRLRQPHGFASPGAFDYEAWLWRQGVQATGYVRAAEQLPDASGWLYPLAKLRGRLQQWLNETASETNRGLFNALLLGDKSAITPKQWQDFSQTGTTHLLVISGLHIGLVAWLGFMLATGLGRLGVLPLRRWPLPYSRALLGMVLALGYAMMAGFGIPVQRALAMTFAALLAPLFGLRASPLTLWALALALVLALDPLAFSSQGFWYSFLAVAGLLFGTVGRCGVQHWFGKMLRPQWLVFLLLTPVLLFNGQPASPLSSLVNLLAIPLVGLVIVPLLLMAALLYFVLPGLAGIFIAVADVLMSALQWGLQWVAGLMWFLPTLQWMSWLALLLALGGVLLLIAPAALGLRWLAVVLIMPLLWPQSVAVAPGQAEVMVLDVGQGLSVLIRTHRHVLIYDTGDRFSESMTAAERVVMPALARSASQRIDKIMISHGDRDHAGGLQSLLSNYACGGVISGTELPEYQGPWTQCKAGDQWQWDGVYFQVLSGGGYPRSNDASCVLKVTAGNQSLLLPGDISARVEKKLLQGDADLNATVLVAAHHGSRYSSGADFLLEVQPQAVIVSSGFGNRFGHPAQETVQRIRDTGADLHTTAQHGTLLFTLGQKRLIIDAYRSSHSRYWWR